MSKTQKEKAFVTAKQIFWEMIGSILIAIGVYNFAVHAEFPMTGFSGISIILTPAASRLCRVSET